MNVEFDIKGLEKLKKNLDILGAEVGAKGARFAGRKAAYVIRDAARVNAARLNDPATTQDIAENITASFSSKEFKRTGDVKFRIGVRGGAKSKKANESNPGGDTFYWRFIEFGTKHISAKPFLRPAMSDNVDKATNTFVSEFDKWLNRTVKRMNK